MSIFNVKLILDSLAPSGARLTTAEWTYPRFIHSEIMTHRLFSRNASSSRAIPVKTMISRIRENPAHPIWWGVNEPGMKAKAELDGVAKDQVQSLWRQAMNDALGTASAMNEWGAHKQIVNRILEPFALMTTIVTATFFDNFFSLRYHPDAQPEFAYLAKLMADCYYNNEPQPVPDGWWHCPYIQEDEQGLDIDTMRKVSVARCARVSYLTQDGKRDIQKDLDLFENLRTGSGHGHWSPFEHVARARTTSSRSGNFWGWTQYRKVFAGEHIGTFDYERAKKEFVIHEES